MCVWFRSVGVCFLSPIERNLQMRANDKRYSGRSNENEMIYGKAFAIGQRSLRTSKFRSMELKKTHFNGAEYPEYQYLEEFCSASSAFLQIHILWDSSLMTKKFTWRVSHFTYPPREKVKWLLLWSKLLGSMDSHETRSSEARYDDFRNAVVLLIGRDAAIGKLVVEGWWKCFFELDWARIKKRCESRRFGWRYTL